MKKKVKVDKPKPNVSKGTSKPLVYGPVANPTTKPKDESNPKKN